MLRRMAFITTLPSQHSNAPTCTEGLYKPDLLPSVLGLASLVCLIRVRHVQRCPFIGAEKNKVYQGEETWSHSQIDR